MAKVINTFSIVKFFKSVQKIIPIRKTDHYLNLLNKQENKAVIPGGLSFTAPLLNKDSFKKIYVKLQNHLVKSRVFFLYRSGKNK